jgi:hypothetical protein
MSHGYTNFWTSTVQVQQIAQQLDQLDPARIPLGAPQDWD